MQPKLNLNTKYCKNTNIVVTFSTLKIKFFLVVKTLPLNFFNAMLFTNVLVQTEMLVTLGKPNTT